MGYVVYNNTTLRQVGWSRYHAPTFDSAIETLVSNATRSADDGERWDAVAGDWRAATTDEAKESYKLDRAADINANVSMNEQIEALRESIGGDNTKLDALNVVVTAAKTTYPAPA